MKYFASDNYSPVDPVVLEAINKANNDYAKSYGNDDITRELNDLVKDLFGEKASIYPCATGTGANVIALQAIAKRYEAIVTSSSSHLHVDEGGAPEKLGLKLFTVSTAEGKLDIDGLLSQAWGFGDVHRAQPRVLSVAESTELGTVYNVTELKELFGKAKDLGMKLHIDGARLFNAAAYLNVELREITEAVGADVITLGGTKNGALAAEAVIDLRGEYAEDIAYLRKSSSQLLSKQRFISAQLLALLKDERWRANANNSNKMARLLREELKDVEEVKFAYPTEANAVFAYLPVELARKLAEEFNFYIWDDSKGLVRWMTSWDTQEEDVKLFTSNIKNYINKGKA